MHMGDVKWTPRWSFERAPPKNPPLLSAMAMVISPSARCDSCPHLYEPNYL